MGTLKLPMPPWTVGICLLDVIFTGDAETHSPCYSPRPSPSPGCSRRGLSSTNANIVEAMSATETRQRLSDYHSFLALAWAVMSDHSHDSDEIRLVLNIVSEFLLTASSRDIRERGKEIQTLLSRAVKIHEAVLPKKKSVREIARDFRLLVKAEPDIWRFGIQSGWLSERFDVSGLPQAEDLPWHARVGVGVHSRNVSVEEVTLLQDAFFLLVRARKSFEAMTACAQLLGLEAHPYKRLSGYQSLGALNSSVCTYSRLGVLTAAAFVEAFVNSVGWHEATVRSDLSEQENAELRGTRKGRYLSLESKLEIIPRIVREDKASPIILSDERQRREPFISFLKETKEVRDASMHYAPGKASILRPPQEWLQLVEAATNHAVAVGREFWSACYPGRQQPRYLARLDYDGLQQEALDRLAAVEAVTGQNTP